MNQGIAFARTIRALQADDFKGSKTGIAIAAILLAAWVWWMLAARVSQYETATGVRVESGLVIAQFPAASEIQPGQSALVFSPAGAIPARVVTVSGDRAGLVVISSQTPAAVSSAEVEISRSSPASIVLQSLGLGAGERGAGERGAGESGAGESGAGERGGIRRGSSGRGQ